MRTWAASLAGLGCAGGMALMMGMMWMMMRRKADEPSHGDRSAPARRDSREAQLAELREELDGLRDERRSSQHEPAV